MEDIVLLLIFLCILISILNHLSKKLKMRNDVLYESNMCTIVRVSDSIVEKRFASSKTTTPLKISYINNEIDITKKLSNVESLKDRVPKFLDSYIDYEHDSKKKRIVDDFIDINSFIKDTMVLEHGINVMRLGYIDGIDLETFIEDVYEMHRSTNIRSKSISMILFVDVTIKILECIAEIHSNKIYHRDIKPSNIIIVKDDKDYYNVKTMDGLKVIIIDFGFSVDMDNMNVDIESCVYRNMGTLGFVHRDFVNRGYEDRRKGIIELIDQDSLMYADIFALGVTLFYMFNEFDEACQDGQRMFYSKCGNVTIDDIIDRMLDDKNSSRPKLYESLRIFKTV